MIAFIIFLSDAPQVSLRLGRTLDADNIRTGHDVYFECDVKANPPALRLEWLHNVSMPLIFFYTTCKPCFGEVLIFKAHVMFL